MKSWLAQHLRNWADRIDPDPLDDLLTVRDLRKELSPDAQRYVEDKYRTLST